MSGVAKLLGSSLLGAVIFYDYWVWSSLFAVGLGNLGALIGLVILALLSFPITGIGLFFGLALLLGD